MNLDLFYGRGNYGHEVAPVDTRQTIQSVIRNYKISFV